ncbi:MAG: alpha/beta hydrolase family protein [Crocosphaera sp.]
MVKITVFKPKSTYLPLLSGCLSVLTLQSVASAFTPFPLYETASSYTTLLETTGSETDPTNIYYPVSEELGKTFPFALMLQGALVDKEDYTNFATIVARYGFIVVVPNHERTISNPFGSATGFFPDVELVNDVLTFMDRENLDGTSPLFGKIETTQMGLLGHSFGGAVGLNAVTGTCQPIICNTTFERPSQLKAGIFYGTNLNEQMMGENLPINNQGVPTGLIQGDLDGVTSLEDAMATYNNIQDPSKIFVTVLGANHYGITNENNPQRDPITPEIDQMIATETIARWSALFLRSHIQGDTEAYNYVYNTGDAMDENVTVSTVTVSESSLVWGLMCVGCSFVFARGTRT